MSTVNTGPDEEFIPIVLSRSFVLEIMNCELLRNVSGPGVFDGPWDSNGFITLYVGTNCTGNCPNNADVAGPGAIWSTIAAALLSDIALLAMIIIDNKLGSSSILHLPSFICKRISDKKQIEKWIIWRTSLIEYILCAADNMAILGTSFLICAYLDTFLINTNRNDLSPLNYQDNYFTAVVYSCCLASCTHIGSLLAIKDHLREHRTSTKIRIVMFTLFAAALCITIDLSEDAFQAFFVYMERLLIFDMHWSVSVESWLVEYTAPVVIVVYLYWISIYPLLRRGSDLHADDGKGKVVEVRQWIIWENLERQFQRFSKLVTNIFPFLNRHSQETGERKKGWVKVCLRFIIFSHPAVALFTHLTFTGVSMTYLLLLKYTKARSPTDQERLEGVREWCSLNTSGNNRWSYGQWLPMFLLLTPLFTSYVKFHDLRNKSKKRPADLESQSSPTILGALPDEDDQPNIPNVASEGLRNDELQEDDETNDIGLQIMRRQNINLGDMDNNSFEEDESSLSGNMQRLNSCASDVPLLPTTPEEFD